MKDGREPVEPSEIIYRRVFAGEGGHYFPGQTPPIASAAFNPSPEDLDGISVTRAAYGLDPASIGAMGFRGKRYIVIGIRASDLNSNGMSIRPDPDAEGGNVGHAIIPEINYRDLQDKTKKREVKRLKECAKNLNLVSIDGPFDGRQPP